jgi:hypothetical protein
MPNKYIRKTDRGMSSREIYELAAEEVTLRNSLRDAAKSYDLNYTSLYRFIKKDDELKFAEVRTTPNIFSPESVRPLPKAAPRKATQQNRRKVKSAILTDTPVKDELAAIEAARQKKKYKSLILKMKMHQSL